MGLISVLSNSCFAEIHILKISEDIVAVVVGVLSIERFVGQWIISFCIVSLTKV